MWVSKNLWNIFLDVISLQYVSRTRQYYTHFFKNVFNSNRLKVSKFQIKKKEKKKKVYITINDNEHISSFKMFESKVAFFYFKNTSFELCKFLNFDIILRKEKEIYKI